MYSFYTEDHKIYSCVHVKWVGPWGSIAARIQGDTFSLQTRWRYLNITQTEKERTSEKQTTKQGLQGIFPLSFLSCDLTIAIHLIINSWLCKVIDLSISSLNMAFNKDWIIY